MSDEGRKKFILIDHSIRALGGHYYEYATHVLEAAARAGYLPVLATNREFELRSDRTDWRVIPVYRYDYWGISGRLRRAQGRRLRLLKALRRSWLRARIEFKYSGFGLSWSLARHPGDLLKMDAHRAKRASWNLLLAFLLLKVLRLLMWLRVRLRSVLRPAFRADPRRLLGAIRRRLKAARGLIATSVRTWVDRGRSALLRLLERRRIQAFARDTARLFSEVEVGPGDFVFIPTLSTVDLLGLGRFLEADPRSVAASWHLLFRRNVYTGREASDYAAEEGSLGAVREAFASFREMTPWHQVRFYTDTDPLTAQYNRLGGTPFETLPIPVNPAFRTKPPAPARESLRITYAGDARSEKGYHLLPEIVRDLHRDCLRPGRVKFVLQSNFAFSNPGKQAPVVAARRRLSQFPSREVEIILRPLTTEEYRDLILSGDLSLLLYDPESYSARSSGVFVESLCAGIPVIVPAGSWMASQIRGWSYRHSAALLRSERILEERRAGELAWTNGTRRETRAGEAGLSLGGGPSHPASTILEVPAGASHLVVSFRFSEETLRSLPGARVLFSAGAEEDGKKRASRSILLEAGPLETPPAAILRLRAASRRLSLTLSGCSRGSLRLDDLQVAFISAGGAVPLGSVGLAYQDPTEVPDLIRDVVEHYRHYRSTAESFAREWSEWHSPERLVADLRRRSAAAEGVPEVGA